MAEEISSKIRNCFEDSISLKQEIIDQGIFEELITMGDWISESVCNEGKLLVCGNGGSAADAQHLVAEFLIRLTSDVNRQGLPALSLVQDSSTFTACVNDFSSEDIFSRNLRTLGNNRDILLVISTSGNSKNIVKVLMEAKELNIKTIGFLGGNGGEALSYCDLSFVVPSNSTARIQEAHITAGHSLLQYVEDKLLQEGYLEILEE